MHGGTGLHMHGGTGLHMHSGMGLHMHGGAGLHMHSSMGLHTHSPIMGPTYTALSAIFSNLQIHQEKKPLIINTCIAWVLSTSDGIKR